MQAVWLYSKTIVPKVPEAIINRDRLYALLKRNPHPRVTIVQAAAGYGKTTILSQWVHQLDEPAAWLSIDIMDNDPSRFWQYVLKAIAQATRQPIDERLEHLFDLQYMPPFELIVDSLLNELMIIESSLHIVLDDYHHIELDIIHEMISRLINYLPEHVHLYMASRTKLPLPVASWRVKNCVTEIGTEELSFTYQEVEAFYQKKHIIMDKTDFCRKILSETGGWAAGVQLGGISEERSAGSLDNSTSFVTEYMMQEIFSTLPESTQQFLLQTSLLKVLDPELCNDLTESSNSYEQLAELVDQGIFTIRLSPKKQTFRYHQLLAEVLEQERNNRYTGEELEALVKKAGGLLYARGEFNTAIDLVLEQQLYTLADQWINEQLLDIFYSGQIRLLIQWVDSLRAAACTVHVETLLIYAISLMTIQDMEKVDVVTKELDNRHEQDGWKDKDEHAELVSILISLKAYVHLALGNLDTFIELITKQVNRGLTNGKWYHAPVHYNLYHAKLTRTPLGTKGNYSSISDIRAFLEIFRQTDFKEHHVMGYSYGLFAEILYEAGQLEEALLEIKDGLHYAHRFNDRGLYVPLSILKGKIFMVQGQSAAAHTVWDHTLNQVPEWYWQRSIQAMKALAYLKENKIEAAETELFKTDRPEPLQIELGQELWLLVYCRLLMAKRAWQEALKIGLQVHEYAAKIDQIDLMIEASTLTAICYKQLKQESLAYVALHTALMSGSQSGYKRIFVDEPGFDHLLKDYQTYKRIRGSFQEEIPLDYLEELAAMGKPMEFLDEGLAALTLRERDVLRLLVSGVSNREMAKLLFLSEGTIRVYLTRIYSKLQVKSRAQAILRAKEWDI
ncbi:LuxR C-terminal-related transcriptional regulator [Oceanobacillus sp. FSL W8-0428]|uniref:LuxR C-terminal-related transcriptional regulator n=1 Tax=Oceanobacillus sp. FSL W8-0428 TaxID=2921715 RepID=UPI0030F7A6A6